MSDIAAASDAVNSVVSKITDVIIMPIIYLLFAAALFYFVFGVARFLIYSKDPTEREKGAKHILWATVGLAIMVSVFGIIRFVASTLGQNVGL